MKYKINGLNSQVIIEGLRDLDMKTLLNYDYIKRI